jgi:pimeloyl-ACP methyl ester carboxylesterase
MQLQTTTLKLDGASIFTSYTRADTPRSDGLTAVFLHGAGQSNSERFAGLSAFFAGHGVAVIALDFIGHGKTGGKMSDNSLALRTSHALAVIGHWTQADVPLILCGSSMSGHTALRVASELGERVKSLWLLQPAVYAREAEDAKFTADFTEILRRPESWKSSHALQDAARFSGKALVTIGSEDKVIPWGVIEALMDNLRKSATETRLEVFDGVGHELPTWLPQHPDTCQDLFDYLVL